MIAGKIIPAIATTTAAITGIVCLQIYTLLQTNDVTYLRGAFINLAVSLYVLTEPQEVIKTKDKEYDNFLLGPVKAVPKDFTVWDKMILNGSHTFKEFIDYFMKEYGIEVQIITCTGVNLIQTFQPSSKKK
jgi:ubiquitin-activating enzyme E1